MSSSPAGLDQQLRVRLDPLAAATMWQTSQHPRQASVLLPLQCIDGVDRVVFTERHADLPHHAGQVSFPGGGREGDETPAQCALRECHEELGVRPADVTLFGSLPPRPSSSRFLVHVVVGRIATGAHHRPQASEVATVLLVPLADLRDPAHWSLHDVPLRAGVRWRGAVFTHDGPMIWGLTARLTLDFLTRLDGQSPLPEAG